MAAIEMQIDIRTTRPRLWPVVRALRPVWRVLPFDVASACVFTLLGTEWSFGRGQTWRRVRRRKELS